LTQPDPPTQQGVFDNLDGDWLERCDGHAA